MQTIRTSGPALGPIIPPVSGLRDINGRLIALDCDVIVDRWRDKRFMQDHAIRARVVAIGDPGLPGREFVRVRPHGSTYIEAASPDAIELHPFDEYAWLVAETTASSELGNNRHDAWGGLQYRGIDLTKCLFGGFYFEHFQRTAAKHYLRGLDQDRSHA